MPFVCESVFNSEQAKRGRAAVGAQQQSGAYLVNCNVVTLSYNGADLLLRASSSLLRSHS